MSDAATPAWFGRGQSRPGLSVSPSDSSDSRRPAEHEHAARRFHQVRRGPLPPRYSFFLNPHRHEAFTRPPCKANMRVREMTLVIHVDSVGLVLLRKTCR